MTGETFRLRGYHVQRLIGRGATSEVWLARAQGSGDLVALKRIRVADAEQRRRADAEAALLSTLDHPNLIRLLALVADHDAVVLVLDLADGGSLADLLAARGRLTPGEVSTALAPVAAALAHLHEAGVVHGDVSAANVLFTAGGVPLLADVGVARLTGDDHDAVATPSYLDPVIAVGQLPGPPSDVFMLAGVALHALTGAPPWTAPTDEAALAQAAGGPDGLSDRLAEAGVPPAMQAVLGRALSADPGRRGTAVDLALGLRQCVTPVAVELAAGRARPVPAIWTGPRHAAETVRPRRAAEPGRPAFERPGPARPGGPPPTRLVGPRPRPSLPGRRGWSAHRPVGRPLGLLLGLLLGLAATGVGVAWWLARPDSSRPSEVNRRAQVQPSARSIDWLATLQRLDTIRAAAFAQRDPARLSQVYVAGPLLAADVDRLRRLVPPGCGLAGVRTRYRALRTTPAGSRAELVVTATLAPSTLVCAGRPRGQAPGVGPVTLRLQVVQTRGGARITDLRPA